MTTKELIDKYGKQHTKLIENAISWLDANEHRWNLETKLDRDAFIKDLIHRTKNDIDKY